MSELPTADRTGQDAIDYTLSRVGGYMPDTGLCLQFARQNYAVPSYYASAIDAWNGATEQHPDDRNPPPSAPVWFWSQSVYRHVATHVGGGRVVSTFNDEIRSFASLAAMENVFGPYMGWAPDLNRHNLRPPGGPAPEPPTDPWKDDLMPWFIRRKDGLIVIVGPTGVRGVTAEQWQTYGNLGYATFKPGFDGMDPGPFDVVVASLGGIVG